MDRLLIVEFLGRDPFAQYRAELFPFFMGYCREIDVPARWVCFGRTEEDWRSGAFVVEPPERDQRALLGLIETFRPTALVSNEKLSPHLAARLRQAAPTLHLSSIAELAVAQGTVAAFHIDVLGDPPDEIVVGYGPDPWKYHVADVAPPLFERELANDEAQRLRRIVTIAAGPECVYQRPLAGNPHFAEVDLGQFASPVGCSFCGTPGAGLNEQRTDPLELAFRQIEACVAGLADDERLPDFNIGGIRVFLDFPGFTDALIARNLPPSRFLFSCRIKEVLRTAETLEANLPRLAERGHRVGLWNMGVENLSPVENARFNKDVTIEHVREVLALVERWEREWTGTFEFSAYQGFGFVTFTPWTRLEDVEIAVEAMAELGLPLDPLFLTSRLILLPNRPIAALARRDGLIVEGFDDPASEAMIAGGCLVSWSQTEIPWRFEAAELPGLYGAMLHLYGTDDLAPRQDPGAMALRARVRASLLARVPAERLVPCLLRAARQEPRGVDAPTLLGRAGRLAVAEDNELRSRLDGPFYVSEGIGEGSFIEGLEAGLRRLGAHPGRPLAGFRLSDARFVRSDRGTMHLHVDLVRGDEALGIILVPRWELAEPFHKAGSLGASYRPEAPVDTREKQRIVGVVTALAARIIERFEGALRERR